MPSSEEFVDVESLESPKKRKCDKYPVGQKKRRKVITSGLRRGRKSKQSSKNSRINSAEVPETLTECFTIVNCVNEDPKSLNLDANESAQNNPNNDADSSEDNSISSENSDENLGGSYIDTCENDILQNNIVRTILQKFQDADLLNHSMAFVNGICENVIKPTNISILLAMEYSYLMSLSNRTKMRYRL